MQNNPLKSDAESQHSDLRLDLEAALLLLTPRQAEALGAWLAGYTQREIGDACGVSQQAIGRIIERAVNRLRGRIGAGGL